MQDITTTYLNRQKELIKRVQIRDGKLNLTLRPDDWQLLSGGQEVADELNKAVAEHYNSGARGVRLMSLCHGVLDTFSEHGTADTEGSQAVCEILFAITGNANYRRYWRHHSDYLDGWKFIDYVVIPDDYLWIGQPDNQPFIEEVARPNSPRSYHSYGPWGVAVAFQSGWHGKFRVEGLFDQERSGRISAIRVVFDD